MILKASLKKQHYLHFIVLQLLLTNIDEICNTVCKYVSVFLGLIIYIYNLIDLLSTRKSLIIHHELNTIEYVTLKLQLSHNIYNQYFVGRAVFHFIFIVYKLITVLFSSSFNFRLSWKIYNVV